MRNFFLIPKSFIVMVLCMALLAVLAGCAGNWRVGNAEAEPDGSADGVHTVNYGSDNNDETDVTFSRMGRQSVEEEIYEAIKHVLGEIGGLAYNEVYQFLMDDGRHILLIGYRPLTSVIEVREFYPNIKLPERAGDFEFRYFFNPSNERNLFDPRVNVGIMVGSGPFFRHVGGRTEQLPMDEALVRKIPAAQFFSAIYSSNDGVYARMNVFPTHMAGCEEAMLCIFLDAYLGLHFSINEFHAVVIYPSAVLELDVILTFIEEYSNNSINAILPRIVDIDALTELASAFKLVGIAERYGWQLEPLGAAQELFVSIPLHE